jgi:hypothetical protein
MTKRGTTKIRTRIETKICSTKIGTKIETKRTCLVSEVRG